MSAQPVVVVIEDQTELGEVIRDVLDDQGFEVLTVRDPDAAMGELRNRGVDLIVADLPTTRSDDGDPLAEIEQAYPDVRVIVVADDSMAQVPFLGPWRVSGSRTTLRRPFRLADLIAASRQAIR
jgi:DNA-binding NtrC family response regulator